MYENKYQLDHMLKYTGNNSPKQSHKIILSPLVLMTYSRNTDMDISIMMRKVKNIFVATIIAKILRICGCVFVPLIILLLTEKEQQ